MFNTPLDLAMGDTLTLFSATGGISGSPAAWSVAPSNHRVRRVGNTLELFRLAAGTIITVR